jgi:hypothetical protein
MLSLMELRMPNQIPVTRAPRDPVCQRSGMQSKTNLFSAVESRCAPWLLGLFLGLALIPTVTWAQTGKKPKPPCLIGAEDCAAIDRGASPKKKWNPGHYMQLKGNPRMDIQANRFVIYDEIAHNEDLEGVVWKVKWSLLEGDTPGDYSEGFKLIHAELDKLESLAVPKRFILRFESISFGNECPEGYPRYLNSNEWLVQTGKSCIFRMWNDKAVTAWIDLLEAYAEEFDDEPYFEAVYLIKESSVGWQGSEPAPDFSKADYWRNLRRIMAAGGAAFVKTNAVMSLNHAPDQDTMNAAMQYAYDSGLGHGDPDTIPESCWKEEPFPKKGDIAYTGMKSHGGVKDFRGDMPALRSAEVSEMGLKLGDCYPSELYDHQNNLIRASHMFWSHNTYAGTAEQQWPAILEFIKSNPMTNTRCPKRYTQGCKTD